ncbi:hypothetical protein ACF0H5_022461 [Mactra antiquata]
MNKFVFPVYLLLGLFGSVIGGNTFCRDDDGSLTAICTENEYCCEEKCCKSGALTVWQIAAIGVGGFVLISVIVILIIACVQKCKKKNKVSQPNGRHTEVTTIASYNEPPPSYSMHNESFQNTIGSQPPPYTALNEKKKPL